MTIETAQFAICDIKADDDARTLEGWASVYDYVDSQKDIVVRGAFAKSLKGKKPAMLWQHSTSQPIGVWDELEEQDRGLWVKGTIIDTALGLDAYKLAKGGAVKGLSIGYSAKRQEWDRDKGTRKLLEVDLYEVSLVTFPANDRAKLTRVKACPATLREFEEYLREGGFSREDATTVALRGFKALSTPGEPDEEVNAHPAAERLAALLTQFKA